MTDPQEQMDAILEGYRTGQLTWQEANEKLAMLVIWSGAFDHLTVKEAATMIAMRTQMVTPVEAAMDRDALPILSPGPDYHSHQLHSPGVSSTNG